MAFDYRIEFIFECAYVGTFLTASTRRYLATGNWKRAPSRFTMSGGSLFTVEGHALLNSHSAFHRLPGGELIIEEVLVDGGSTQFWEQYSCVDSLNSGSKVTQDRTLVSGAWGLLYLC